MVGKVGYTSAFYICLYNKIFYVWLYRKCTIYGSKRSVLYMTIESEILSN